MMLRAVAYTGAGDPDLLLPPVYEHSRPHYAALDSGHLLLQQCEACRLQRFPVAPCCPHCGQMGGAWVEHAGEGRLHSWIRYHKSYLPEFAHDMPYVVGIVQLLNGPRMTGRWLSEAQPWIGMSVTVVIERFPGGRSAPALVPSNSDVEAGSRHESLLHAADLPTEAK